jgi:hypothetical protein
VKPEWVNKWPQFLDSYMMMMMMMTMMMMMVVLVVVRRKSCCSVLKTFMLHLQIYATRYNETVYCYNEFFESKAKEQKMTFLSYFVFKLFNISEHSL